MCEEFEVAESFGFLLEYFDEGVAYDFSFLFWVGNALEFVKESVGGIDYIKIDMEIFAEGFLNLVPFAFAQNAVVDEDACEPVSNSLVNEYRNDGGIHSPAQAAHHVSVTHL